MHILHWSNHRTTKHIGVQRCKMSAERDLSNGENIRNLEREEYVVTDSVHERFRQIHVRCDDCNSDVVGNEAAIKKHFNNSHPSNRHCRYCKGKVFVYRKITTMDGDGREMSHSYVYHKCEHKEQPDMNVTKESI